MVKVTINMVADVCSTRVGIAEGSNPDGGFDPLENNRLKGTRKVAKEKKVSFDTSTQ